MAAIVEAVNRWSAATMELAWSVTWQAAVLIVVAGAAGVLLRRASPGLRYWLWQIVAIKILLMPFWTMAVPLPLLSLSGPRPAAAAPEAPFVAFAERAERSSGIPTTRRLPSGPQPPAPSRWTAIRAISWQSWLLAAWLMVVAAQFVVLARQGIHLRRLLEGASPAHEPLRVLIAELAGQLGLRRVPAAVVTDADCSFFACGVWRPLLVLPRRLLAALDDSRLRQVLLHELAHVKRFDLVFGWPVEIAQRLWFFHPLVHWLAYRIRLERELACDQLAMVSSGGSPSDYIATLLHVVAQASEPPVLKAAAISAPLYGSAEQRNEEASHDR